MSRLEWIVWVDLVLSSALAAGAYLLGGQGLIAAACILLGCAWITVFHRRWHGAGPLVLVSAFLISFAGIVLRLNSFLLAFSFLSALNGWDLIHFSLRAAAADQVNDRLRLENVHLRKLLEVDIFSISLIAVALTIQLHLPFGWILLLCVTAVIVLARLIRTIPKENL